MSLAILAVWLQGVIPDRAPPTSLAESRAPEAQRLLPKATPHPWHASPSSESTHALSISRHTSAHPSHHASLHPPIWRETRHKHHGHVLCVDAPEGAPKHGAISGLLSLVAEKSTKFIAKSAKHSKTEEGWCSVRCSKEKTNVTITLSDYGRNTVKSSCFKLLQFSKQLAFALFLISLNMSSSVHFLFPLKPVSIFCACLVLSYEMVSLSEVQYFDYSESYTPSKGKAAKARWVSVDMTHKVSNTWSTFI